jgi:hypothetical protein
MPAVNKELHRTGRIGWLCSTVLGANDGILSSSGNCQGRPEPKLTKTANPTGVRTVGLCF